MFGALSVQVPDSWYDVKDGGTPLDAPTLEPLNRSLRLHFLSDLTALESLCRTESLVRLETTTKSLNSRDKRNFLRGYRLAVATTLNSLLDFVARNADSLGLECDDRLSHWLSYGSPDSGVSVLSAVTDLESDLALMCSGLDGLFDVLRSSDRGLGETITAIKRCGEFGSILRAALGKCEVVSLSDGSRVADGDSLLPVLIAERVVDYTWLPSHFIPLAFQLVWGGEEEFPPLSDESTLEAQTHLDGVSSWPFGRPIPERWWDGLYFGFDSVIRMEGVSLPSHASSDTEPLARIHRRTALGTDLEESGECSSESGIMVLEQKPARKQGAPNRCCHRTNPTVSASSLTTIAWWPMPACSCRPPSPGTWACENSSTITLTSAARRDGRTLGTRC